MQLICDDELIMHGNGGSIDILRILNAVVDSVNARRGFHSIFHTFFAMHSETRKRNMLGVQANGNSFDLSKIHGVHLKFDAVNQISQISSLSMHDYC